MSTTDGGPAFPGEHMNLESIELLRKARENGSALSMFQLQTLAKMHPGMSLRDYFAAMAMQGMCADGKTNAHLDSTIAVGAYSLADAMLVARSAS
jgi:hypothetical protein